MNQLSSKAICVLEMIAEGHSYAQIIEHYPDLIYPDIFGAAAEALQLAGPTEQPTPASGNERSRLWEERLVEIRRNSPRAYEKWDQTEDARLVAMFNEGLTTKQIATTLERQVSAIRSRILKLELMP